MKRVKETTIKKYSTIAAQRFISRHLDELGLEHLASELLDQARPQLIENCLAFNDGIHDLQQDDQIEVNVTNQTFDRLYVDAQARDDSNEFLSVDLSTATFDAGEDNFVVTDTAGNEKRLRFGRLGAGYIRERIDGWTYAELVELLASQGQAGIAKVLANNPIGGEVVLAVRNQHIMGIMRNYNPVVHGDLVNAIRLAGLGGRVEHYYFTDQSMSVRISDGRDVLLADRTRQPYAYLRVENGDTGHVALGYYGFIAFGDYEHSVRLGDRRRHLSTVNEAVESLQDAMDQVAEFAVELALVNMSESDVRGLFTGQYNKREQEILDDADYTDGLTFATSVERKFGERGFKLASKNLLSTLFNAALA